MERLAGELIGLPVMTLDSGVTIAHVEDMIVDPSRRQVLALVVQERAFARPARAIPFGRIAANGTDAVLVQHVKVSLEMDRDPVLRGLDNAQTVQGAIVMADTGHKIGKVTDMLIDDHTGEIKSYEIVVGNDGQKESLPADGVVNMGRDVLYVTSAVAESFSNKATKAIDVENIADGDGGQVETPLTGTKRRSKTSAAESLPAAPAAATSPVGGVSAISGLTNIIGGNTMNMRLVLGIVVLVLGILILVYPALLPLIAGISLIVLGLWIALQNAPIGSRP